MLSTQFKEFDLGTRYPQLKPLLGDGIFTLSGDGWFHSRAMLRPQFTKDQVANLAGFEKHVDRLLGLFESSTKDGQVIDVQPFFHSLTLDFSCEFLFGEDIKSLIGGREDLTCDPNEFQDAFDAAQEFVMTRSQLGSLYYLYDSFKFRRDIKVCKKFVERFVHKALNIHDGVKEDGRYVFINALAKQTQDPVVLRDQCLNVLLAGRDTTASLLSLSVYLLARHKDVWASLRRHVLHQFGHAKDDITYDGLRSCQYLKNFINEVMRFYSIVPFNFRHCNRDTTLPRGGGPEELEPVFVPKGTTVYYIPYAMHRSPKFWGEDAHEFNPDRWNDKKNSPSHPWAFIPFNGGPRVCIGQQLALAETSYTLVCLIQQFKDISSPPGVLEVPFKERVGLILTSGDGVRVSFTRDDNRAI
ncbi:hypothetical protein TRVA0_002S03884 [Trichomonascus vanleenenianus]|uniref:cytochrome P450 n=1 Tax=Trichomonascus vanleenenianus TaxID=2268995 RepID=UPI003ECAB38A